MARIAYVKAWGLWSHFESTFEIAPGLTVITGPNGSGKSTFIRIVRWVFLGEPAGEAFLWKLQDDDGNIIKQAEEGRAEIGLDDGVVITKTRRKGKTTYTHSSYPEPFEKAEVPQEIIDALGIKKYTFGDFETYLNFAFQLDAPFLISEAPSVGAKVLGKLAGTEVIDLAIAEMAKRTHKAREDERLAKKEVERCNGDLLDYLDLDDLKQQVQACEYLVADVEKAHTRRDNLAGLSLSLEHSTGRLLTLATELTALAMVPELAAALEQIDEAQADYETLLELKDQHSSNALLLEALGRQLADLIGIEALGAALVQIDAKDNRLTKLSLLQDGHAFATRQITAYEDFLSQAKDLDVAAADLEHIERQQTRAAQLDLLGRAWRLADMNALQADVEIGAYSGLNDAQGILCIIDATNDRLGTLQQLQRDYTIRDTVAKTAVKDLAAAEAAYTEADNELTQAWDAAGGICPLCNQPVDQEHRH